MAVEGTTVSVIRRDLPVGLAAPEEEEVGNRQAFCGRLAPDCLKSKEDACPNSSQNNEGREVFEYSTRNGRRAAMNRIVAW